MRFNGGARRCRADCLLIGCYRQKCGYDECVTLEIEDKNDSTKLKCASYIKDDRGNLMVNPDFDNDSECAQRVGDTGFTTFGGGEVRLRSVILPDKHICIFADAKHEAQDNWRVRGLVPYVGKDYKEFDQLITNRNPPIPGKVWYQQFCHKYEDKVDLTKTFGVVNCENNDQERLCEPPVRAMFDENQIIDNAVTTSSPFSNVEGKLSFFNQFYNDRLITINNKGEPVERSQITDFFNPTILVNYGSELSISSLKTGCLGGKNEQDGVNDISSPCRNLGYSPSQNLLPIMSIDSSYNIKISDDGIIKMRSNFHNNVDAITYDEMLYLEKTGGGNVPGIRLYDKNGYQKFYAPRQLPEYNNIMLNYDNSSNRFSIALDDLNSNTVNAGSVIMEQNIESIKDDTECFDISNENNKKKLEFMRFCLKRDLCGALFEECIANDFLNINYDQRNSLWNRCFDNNDISLISQCSKKWGINNALTDSAKIQQNIDNITNYETLEGNYYGWFHEVCLDSAHYQPVPIYAHKILDSDNNFIDGKCLLDPVLSGNATIDNNNTPDYYSDDQIIANAFAFDNECNARGDESISYGSGKKCTCLRANISLDPLSSKKIEFLLDNFPSLTDNYIVRNAKSKELGLCFDKQLPGRCDAITYDNYAQRTNAVASYHAEYPSIFLPYDNFNDGVEISGSCNLNWTESQGRNPRQTCIRNGNGSFSFVDSVISLNITPISINANSNNANITAIIPDDQTLESLLISGDLITLIAANNRFEAVVTNISYSNNQIAITLNNIPTSNISVSAIEINKSSNRSCVRHQCKIKTYSSIPAYSTNYLEIGGSYSPSYGVAPTNPDNAHQKAADLAYAYWNDDDVESSDVIQYFPATGCLTGFEVGSGGFPNRICNPLGEVTTDIQNSCQRKQCNIDNDFTDPDIVRNIYQGANFSTFDLNNNNLKASRAISETIFDFGVTNVNERSTVTGSCYYSPAEGLTYVRSPNAQLPILACKNDATINPDLYLGKCVKANCEDDIDSSPSTMTGINIFDGNGYVDALGGVYILASEQCSISGYKKYPYNVQKRYHDSRFSNNIANPASFMIDNSNIIRGDTNPIRNCYNSNDIDSGVYVRSWNSADNPCINGCLGADKFRESMGHSKSDINSNMTIDHNDIRTIITINEDLSNNPPKKIIYPNGQEIIIADYSSNINIRYPNYAEEQPPLITNIEIYSNINNARSSGNAFPLSQIPSRIELVNRINTGITKHLVSTATKTIDIEWPNAEFGTIQYAYFDNGDAGTNPLNISGNHYQIYALDCTNKENCGQINISNNLPSGYFNSGRDNGEFLIARRCNNDGIWTGILPGIDDALDRDPNQAQNKATILAMGKGIFDNGRKVITALNDDIDSTPILAEGDIIASKYYNDIAGETLNINYNGNQINPVAKINNTADYSMASTTNGDKKYSIKRVQFEERDANGNGYIDKISLIEVSNASPTLSNGVYNIALSNSNFVMNPIEAQSYRICHASSLQNTISYNSSANNIVVDNSISNFNSVISSESLFIARDSNTHEIERSNSPIRNLVGTSRNSVSGYARDARSVVDRSHQTSLSDQINNDNYYRGQIVTYNYCKEGWEKDSSRANPVATCGNNGNWNININSDNCIRRCQLNYDDYRWGTGGHYRDLRATFHVRVTEYNDYLLENETVNLKLFSQYQGRGKESYFNFSCNSDGTVNYDMGTIDNGQLSSDDCTPNNLYFCGNWWCVNNDRARFFVNSNNPRSFGNANIYVDWGGQINSHRIDGKHNCSW